MDILTKQFQKKRIFILSRSILENDKKYVLLGENELIVYVSGKYSGNIDENIALARKVAIEVWESGNVALTPHLNTAHFEQDCKCSYDDYMNGYLDLVWKCDAILMLPGWEQSNGAIKELNLARKELIPEYYYPNLP